MHRMGVYDGQGGGSSSSSSGGGGGGSGGGAVVVWWWGGGPRGEKTGAAVVDAWMVGKTQEGGPRKRGRQYMGNITGSNPERPYISGNL